MMLGSHGKQEIRNNLTFFTRYCVSFHVAYRYKRVKFTTTTV